MSNQPIHVYLDSSDYSRLSNPSCQTESTIEIRNQLLEWSKSGQVKFLYSGILLLEMAPMEAVHTPLASLRADLLVDLCGRNALISFDRLLTLEFASINTQRPGGESVRSSDADWFPDLGNIISPVNWAEAIQDVDSAGKKHSLNRQHRRTLKRKIFKKNKPTKEAVRAILGDDLTKQLDEFLGLYPMRPSDAEVLWKYVLGLTTTAEADRAFKESLRDPKWMMRWFAQHHDQMSPLIDWLRGPSKALMADTKRMTEQASQIVLFEETLGIPKGQRTLTKKVWNQHQDEMVVKVSSSVVTKLDPDFRGQIDLNQFDQNCPGFSTCLRALHSSIWSSVGQASRMPKDSDVVDALHALYAPYVDVFRADSFMAPFIADQVRQNGTIVVSKLELLVQTVQMLLHTDRTANA
ncbi:MAG: hypothetical protein Q8K67_13445 [Geothrix sp.]|nr:hypothetical protein [Geothrix sp.]